ncbi:hypothetical protein SAMN04488128_106406 [Chitinophaga eiseniae]|uniref:Uncharacterized protein n=1 Tax=Chitinophaga eiseniae TaxID=634771 RepID=A0A1T4TVG9_9BACT|nr:hypothetical protein [Chitinophaga eiseniae]SKA44452.1 hypothetical protein SAMN04488128_106406 [Chitinophaga eiseniae]
MDNAIAKGQADQAPLSLASFISYPYQNFQGVPVTQFTAGSPFSVRWDSNGTNFSLYVNGNSQPLYTGNATSTDLPRGLQANTTLILEADNGEDKRYAFLTVIISNPVLTPDTIWHDTGTMTNAGTLDVKGSLYNTTLTFGSEGVLNLGDNSSFQGLTVSQNANISGATSANNLQRPPNSNINDLTITNNLNADGITIAMIGGGHLLRFGSAFDTVEVTAKTDGFAIITINPKDCDTNVWSSCTITYGFQQYTVNGMVLEEDSTADIPQSGYCCIPIRNGDSWSCSGTTSGGDRMPMISVFWVPLGGGSDSYTTSG